MTVALVVDDHPEGIYLLRCLMQAEGYEVLEASNGREALAAAQAKTVDLIVSDILMPVMDGFSLCRACRSDPRLAAVPFIFYTATYVDKRDEDLAMSLGADLFLIKPAEPEVLMDHIREVLARRRAGTLPPKPEVGAEAPFLQQYSQVLIHKLEDKLEELEKANQALRLKDFALASSPNGILFVRGQGEIAYVNPAMARMAGKSIGDVLHQPVARLFAEPAAFDKWFGSAGAGVMEMELAALTSGGLATWVRVERHAITNDDGTSLGYMLSCTDVTQERNLRREFARVARLESLGLFAAGVAHDFNNLLMSIFTSLELETAPTISEADRELNRTTARAAFVRARDLTRRLLTFAKGSRSERRPTDLRGLLDESILLSLSGSAIHCNKHYCDEPAVALVDPGQIAQVMSNLLVNARQAMGDVGSLAATVKVEDMPSTAGAGTIRAVKVTIADAGPGIPSEILDKIFEPYFTTKRDGTGLGLATSHAIVAEHDGQISVSSRPGVGTTFVVSIPAADESLASSTPATGKPARARNERILVMDDEVAIQSLVKQGLEKAGYAVVVVGNGEQALLEIGRAQSEGHPFDLAILDITVKGGMGGIEAIQELRRMDPNLPAIATTGYAASADLRSHGFVGVIAKPFMLHELCATISAVLP
jgi:two-component system, cell cycle sensor histidine kinase and response regulator CckA